MLAEKIGLTNRRHKPIRVFFPKGFYINQQSLILMGRESSFHSTCMQPYVQDNRIANHMNMKKRNNRQWFLGQRGLNTESFTNVVHSPSRPMVWLNVSIQYITAFLYWIWKLVQLMSCVWVWQRLQQREGLRDGSREVACGPSRLQNQRLTRSILTVPPEGLRKSGKR